ncbi:hypothetical protein D0T53_09065 [Dysgonomonas sp. 216]|uniref:PSP1 domain-containing protein n=1 Tax=Dysgonomonas sp. 216 TaxID=2302934 RepID=UPI0013D5777B|nr:regulatory iron-sulfur-containing complex subunit RicT [Dysgonomonas sp. 216]NDW19061.1 hypothetical protein [Dysgonomonas sp. 216]
MENTNVDNNINTLNTCTCGKNPEGECGCKAGAGCNDTTECDKKGRCWCTKGTHKLEVLDWLCDLPEALDETQMVEVQFKNTRKGYYLNSNNIDLYKGDIVAVEATPGHDIGEVTLTGKLVLLQMKKTNYRPQQGEHKRIYRIAKPNDLDKYKEAKALEHKTMLRAREIAEDMGLLMKISDVEYQGDGNKAIFYYIADERVDFRQLIKVYAEQFRVKIEMKQIGARQEAGRVGGIGPCGRELCCSSSISSFVSVSTSAARFQDISLNPQKLAGQCGKLKCCLNYEVDTYLEAQKQLPSREIPLETKDSVFFHFKTDILSGQMTYSTDKNFAANLVSIDKERVFQIIKLNRRGKKPLHLISDDEMPEDNKIASNDILEDNINRFDESKKKKPKKKLNRNNGGRPDDKQQTAISEEKSAGSDNVSNNNNNTEAGKPRSNNNRRNRNNRNSRQQSKGAEGEGGKNIQVRNNNREKRKDNNNDNSESGQDKKNE